MASHSAKYSMAHNDDNNDTSFGSIERRKNCCQRHYIACTIFVVLILLLVVLGGLLFVAFIRALLMKVPSYVDDSTMEQILQLPSISGSTFENLPAILGTALTFPTITNSSGYYEHEPFRALREFLEKSFPHVFTSNIVEVDERFPSFLLTVQGNGVNTTANSFLLLAHIDVVPVDASAWDDNPFSGKWVAQENGGYVYGRGAIDDKLGVVAILCALNELLGSGWSPNSTFYVAFGHDEEVSGHFGAGELAKVLESKGVEDLFFILDEGMPVVQGFMDCLDVPAALIGVSEKGWMDLRVEASGVAGHSSIPPHQQATHSLATAIHNLHSTPHPVFQGGPEEAMFLALAPKSSWPLRLALSNPWLFRPLISAVLASKRETDALQRTTTATTIIQGGTKDNVVPGTAWALVNHRIHPYESLDEVVQHDTAAINDDTINITVLGAREPHPISPYGPQSEAFSLLAATYLRVYPDAVPAPTMLIANTDTRHYLQFSRSVYRSMPYLLGPEDLALIHGDNERISAANVWRATQFYHTLIVAAAGGLGGRGHGLDTARGLGEL